MPKYSKNQQPSEEIRAEAMRVAKATQRPGQTKEQTKLIAQGIQKGIEQYKKQQGAKDRERDKRNKKLAPAGPVPQVPRINETKLPASRCLLPWVLLALSWAGIAVYVITHYV